MANQPKNDDLLDNLFTGLKDFLNTPLPGTEQSANPSSPNNPAPVVEEGALYDKLKDIFNTSLPGTDEGSADSGNDSGISFESGIPIQSTKQAPAGSGLTMPTAKEDWAALRENHKKEREELSARHAKEREAMKAYRAKITEAKKSDVQSGKKKAKKDDDSHEYGKRKRKGKDRDGDNRGRGKGRGRRGKDC